MRSIPWYCLPPSYLSPLSTYVAIEAYDMYHYDNAIPPTKFTDIISSESNLKQNVKILSLDFYDAYFDPYAPNYHEKKVHT
jgi:hypothetical protein